LPVQITSGTRNLTLTLYPTIFQHPKTLNLLAGFFELFFAILLAFPKTRLLAAWGIVFMLIAFLPVHINMIRNAPIHMGGIRVTPLMAWIRLAILQPLLIYWAWWYTNEINRDNHLWQPTNRAKLR
jgi:uncharacterized membrane protein